MTTEQPSTQPVAQPVAQPATPSRPSARPTQSPDLLLGLATAPVLLALVAGRALSGLARDLGLLSEEVFRGDRLPVRDFPTPSNDDSGCSS